MFDIFNCFWMFRIRIQIYVCSPYILFARCPFFYAVGRVFTDMQHSDVGERHHTFRGTIQGNPDRSDEMLWREPSMGHGKI